MTDDRRQRQVELLRGAFVKQDRETATYYIYNNDERYYVVLSACEDLDIRFAVKSNCIMVEAVEFERAVPVLATPKKEPMLFGAQMHSTIAPSIEPVISQEAPVRPSILRQDAIMPSVAERLATVTSKSTEVRESSAATRRKTLDMREQAVREREIAVYEREVAADSREEELEERRLTMNTRKQEMQERENTQTAFSRELEQRQLYIRVQHQEIGALKKLIKETVEREFFPSHG